MPSYNPVDSAVNTTRKAPPLKIPCGADVGRTERLKWLAVVTGRPFLSASAKALAARLMVKYADRQGLAYPSMTRLANDLGLCRRTIIRVIDELHYAGFIDVVSGKKNGRANHYTLTWPCGKRNIVRLGV